MLALTVVCIISSCRPLFAAWSAFSFPGIPVWAGIQLIVGLCVNLDAASLMVLGIVFSPSSYCLVCLQLSSVCIVILSLVSLAFSRATRMAAISAFSHLIIISSSLCTTAAAIRVPSLEPSV